MNQCQYNEPGIIKTGVAAFLMYQPTILSTKIVLCALYLRLFKSVQWIRYATWTVLIIYTLICTLCFSIYLVDAVFTKFDGYPDGPIKQDPAAIAQLTMNVIIDLSLLAMPIRPIMKMQTLSLRKKISLLAVFLAGFGATACTIVLLGYDVIYYYPSAKEMNTLIAQDFTWTGAEMNVLV